jgi:hypothetical protein
VEANEMTPQVSLLCSTVHWENWPRLFDSLINDGADIEYVFVGPGHKHVGTVPGQFRYIETRVKPVQCLEIAARVATGTYVIPIADDVTFSHEAVGKALYWMGRMRGEYDVVGMRYARIVYGTLLEERNDQAALEPSISGPPVVPILPMFRREAWHKLGGLDRTFAGVLADTDLVMRALERGGHPFISPDSIMIEAATTIDEMDRLSHACRDDRIRLVALWVEVNTEGANVIRKARAEPVQPFCDGDLLGKTQGKKGRW